MCLQTDAVSVFQPLGGSRPGALALAEALVLFSENARKWEGGKVIWATVVRGGVMPQGLRLRGFCGGGFRVDTADSASGQPDWGTTFQGGRVPLVGVAGVVFASLDPRGVDLVRCGLWTATKLT